MEIWQYSKATDGDGSPIPLASPLSPFSPFRPDDLSSPLTEHQLSSRGYISTVLIFPFEGEKTEAETHIKASLERLKHQEQRYAASLKTNPQNGQISLEKHSRDEIPFKVIDLKKKIPYSFARLQKEEFTPSAFVHPDIVPDGTLLPFSLVPVTQVRLSFIEGGLILWLHLHKVVGGGNGLQKLLGRFSAATCGGNLDDVRDPNSPGFKDNVEDNSLSCSFTELLSDRNDNHIQLNRSSAPVGTPAAQLNYHMAHTITNASQKSRMLVFRLDRLDQLKSLVLAIEPQGGSWSTHAVLAALTWAHTTKARMMAEPTVTADALDQLPARLLTDTIRSSHISTHFGETGSFVNTVSTSSVTTIPISETTRACENFTAIVSLIKCIEEDKTTALKPIEKGKTTGEEAELSRLTAELDVDAQKPHQLAFISLKHLGIDNEWSIPGIRSASPSAVRLARANNNAMGYAHILPAKKESEVLELEICISEAAMKVLLHDDDYMRWVDHVVE